MFDSWRKQLRQHNGERLIESSGSTDAKIFVGQPKRLILMRGLPSCGKSTRARELVATGGASFEFDEYFYTQLGEDPTRYDWSRVHLDDARAWNIKRICAALDEGLTPIVLDDDNSYGMTTRRCVRHAASLGYVIDFCEPETPWWNEIRKLLRDKNANRAALEKWAQKLTVLSRGMHRVPIESFRRRMERWQDVIDLEEILESPDLTKSRPLEKS